MEKTESCKNELIKVLDEGLTNAFGVTFKDLQGKLYANTSKSLYAAFTIYYLKNVIGLKITTIMKLFDKPSDQIVVQLDLINKYFDNKKENLLFTHTIARDRKELVDKLYPILFHNMKTFIIEVFACNYEASLKSQKQELKNVIRANKERNSIKG